VREAFMALNANIHDAEKY